MARPPRFTVPEVRNPKKLAILLERLAKELKREQSATEARVVALRASVGNMEPIVNQVQGGGFVKLAPASPADNVIAPPTDVRALAIRAAALATAKALELLGAADAVLFSLDALGNIAGANATLDDVLCETLAASNAFSVAEMTAGEHETLSAAASAARDSGDFDGTRLFGGKASATMTLSGTGGATGDNLVCGLRGKGILAYSGSGDIDPGPPVGGLIGVPVVSEEVPLAFGVLGCFPADNDADSRIGLVGGVAEADILSHSYPAGAWGLYAAERSIVRGALWATQITLHESDAAKVHWLTGTGTPEGAVAAPVGSHFSRQDGGAGTTLYVKESGTGNTGWVGK